MIINHEVDLEALHATIDNSLDLNDNEALFAQLASISVAKKEVADLLESVGKIELEAKMAINAKAKQLYGTNWQAIAGKGYKISRSPTGLLYTRNPDVPVSKKYLKIVESLNSDVITGELEKTGKLPKGVEINPTRGETIRITVK